jgi:hypothetical protein
MGIYRGMHMRDIRNRIGCRGEPADYSGGGEKFNSSFSKGYLAG